MSAQRWRGLAVGAALGLLAWSATAQQALARAHLEKLAPVASVVVDAATVDAAVRHVFE